MKRFILIFLALSATELAVYISPIRIDKTDNPDARIVMKAGFDSLEMKYNGHVFVKVRINDDTTGYWFLWDTGAQASFIDEELVDKYNLKDVGFGRNVDSNLKGRQTIRYSIDTIRLNNTIYKDFIFSSLYIEQPECGEKKFRGIIGANIIRNTDWLIHYNDGKLIIAKPDSLLVSERIFQVVSDTVKPATIPFATSMSKGVPKMDMSLAGENIDDVIFDTGYNGSIVLPVDIYDGSDSLQNIEVKMKTYGEVSKGLFGPVSGSLIYINVDTVQLGELYLVNQLVSFQAKTIKLLGNGILKNYLMHLKYSKDEVTLYKLPVKRNKYTIRRRGFGFNFKLEEGVLKVSMVQENSPADEAGLEYNDEILCINESKFHGDECELEEWYSNFLCESIILEVEDKGTLELSYEK